MRLRIVSRAAPLDGAASADRSQPRASSTSRTTRSRALVRSVLEPRGFDVLEASDGMGT